MSSFICEKCGVTQQDSDRGYIAGCAHYPPEHGNYVIIDFGNGITEQAFHEGAWYRSVLAYNQGLAVHPLTWSMPFDTTENS